MKIDTIPELKKKYYKAHMVYKSGSVKQALEIMNEIISVIDCEPQIVNDEIHISTSNLIENVLYCLIYKPSCTVISPLLEYSDMFTFYAYLLFEVNMHDNAIFMLYKALLWNPVNTNAMFELAENYKAIGNIEQIYKISKEALKFCYTNEEIARAYRNCGFYFIERKEFKKASVLFYISLEYQNHLQAYNELNFIEYNIGLKYPIPSKKMMREMLISENIQNGPSQNVLRAFSIIIDNPSTGTEYYIKKLKGLENKITPLSL